MKNQQIHVAAEDQQNNNKGELQQKRSEKIKRNKTNIS